MGVWGRWGFGGRWGGLVALRLPHYQRLARLWDRILLSLQTDKTKINGPEAVWPDDGIKSCLISPKIAQNIATHFFIIVTLLEIAQKVTKIFGSHLWDNLLPKTRKNRQSGHTDRKYPIFELKIAVVRFNKRLCLHIRNCSEVERYYDLEINFDNIFVYFCQ